MEHAKNFANLAENLIASSNEGSELQQYFDNLAETFAAQDHNHYL